MSCLLLTTKPSGFRLASLTSLVSPPSPPLSPLEHFKVFLNVVGLQGVEFTFVLFKVAVGKTMFWDQGEEPEVVPEGFDSLCLEGEIPFPVCGGKDDNGFLGLEEDLFAPLCWVTMMK